MRMSSRLAAALGLALVLGGGAALADKPDWAGGGKGHGGGERGQGPAGHEPGGPPGQGQGPKAERGQAPAPGRISPQDVVVVRQYFSAYPVQTAPLPPGIAKKLARGKPLPPGIAKKIAPIELRQQIPLCMNGWECILAGADMLILDAVHGTIRDIVRGVVR